MKGVVHAVVEFRGRGESGPEGERKARITKREFFLFFPSSNKCENLSWPIITHFGCRTKKPRRPTVRQKRDSNQQSARTRTWPHSCTVGAKTHYRIRRAATDTTVFRSSLSCSRAQTNKLRRSVLRLMWSSHSFFSFSWFSYSGRKQTTLFARWGVFLTYNSWWQKKSLNHTREPGSKEDMQIPSLPLGTQVFSARLSN